MFYTLIEHGFFDQSERPIYIIIIDLRGCYTGFVFTDIICMLREKMWTFCRDLQH